MARVLVVLFALVIGGFTFAIGSIVLGGPPLLGDMGTFLADPDAPVARDDTSLQVFTVAPGASAAEIGDELQGRGLVRSALVFRWDVEQQGVSDRLAAGDYELSPSLRTTDVVQVLASGQVKHGPSATIPEGWRAEQIADKLAQTGVTSRDDFLRAVNSAASVPNVGLLGDLAGASSLEGYLFPETYEVRESAPGAQVVSMMVQMFDQRLDAELTPGAAAVHLTPRQVLIVASIVEREAQLPSERPLIASVYLNRLSRGMQLQADPTVQFAVASRDGPAAATYNYWKTTLTDADLSVESAYNTYLHTGLPPGPICDPGQASVEAVLRPASTDYLYFVAKGDGSHLFASTLDEHNANVQRAHQ